jgi:hypothetical protein
MKRNLEIVTNLATIAACAFVIGHLALSYSSTSSSRVANTYSPGEVIADSNELGFANAHLTLIMATASTCHFCTESMDYYGRLTGVARQHHVRILAVTPEEPAENRRYLAVHGITPDTVTSAISNQIRINGTPALILVRTDGRVVKSWLGKLNPSAENEILGLVEAG